MIQDMSMMGSSGRVNFDHEVCYRDNLHEKSKRGRDWCRQYGPASRSGRVYSKPAKPVSEVRHRSGEVDPSSKYRNEEVLRRRTDAAERYRPAPIRLLLIAEAPPSAPDRYFYFGDVPTHDSLFRYVSRALLPRATPTRENKPALLAQLRDRGVFLIDLKPDPVDDTPLSSYVPDLLRRIEELAPERIVLIKATVYDAAFLALASAGLPVTSVRIPFPGSGQQKAFEQQFGKALQECSFAL